MSDIGTFSGAMPVEVQTEDVREIETIGCVVCGARMPILDGRQNRKLYCSQKCRSVSRRVFRGDS